MKTYLRSSIIVPLLCGVAMLWMTMPVRAQIALHDGSIGSVFDAANGIVFNGAASVTVPVTNTAGANTLVFMCGARNANTSGNTFPATLPWGSQTLTRIFNADAGATSDRTIAIYYLYNPLPGTNNITVSLATASSASHVFGGFYTLSGVDTNVAPLSSSYGGSGISSITITRAGVYPGSWAAFVAQTSVASASATGQVPTITGTDGTVYESTDSQNGISSTTFGYITNLSLGTDTFVANWPTTGTQRQCFGVAVFAPVGPPVVATQPSPASLTAYSNSTVSISATVAGSPPLAYQWQLNGVAISSATNTTLNFSNVTGSQAGNYTVAITNSYGSVTSSVASLTVLPYPTPQTAAVGVQFYGGNVQGGLALTPDQVAGVYAISNWNVDADKNAILNNLVDNSNVNTEATLGGAFSAGYWGTSDNTATPDGILNSSGFWVNGTGGYTITMHNILNYANYDVYVYVLNDTAARRWAATITNADVPTYWGSTINGSTEGNPYVYYQATNTSTVGLTGATMPAANYAHFTGVSGTNFTVAGQSPDGNIAVMGIEIVRNEISPTNSGITTAGTNSIIANGTSTQVITVQARYFNGANRLQGGTVGTGGANVVFNKTLGAGTLSGTTDNGNGTYSATLTSPTVPGSATVTATLNGMAVGSGGTSTSSQTVVNFVPGPASATNSIVSPASASITANGTSTQVITVQARDQYNNNLTNGGSTVVFGVTGGGSISGTTDNGNGTYSATLTSPTTVGSVTVTATLGGTAVGTAVSASSSVVTYVAGPAAATTVETAPNGSGTVSGPSTIPVSGSLTVYAVARDANGNYVGNPSATWSLVNITGGVSGGDLANNGTSATLTGHSPGSAQIQAVANTFNGVSGVKTVVAAGAQTVTRVETAPDGSGTVYGPASLTAGSSVTVYAIARDASGYFIRNTNASWSLQSITGGVVSGDLTVNGAGASATLTGHATGSAVIRAVAGGFTGNSGAATVTTGAANAAYSTVSPATASIVANGTSTRVITVQVRDANSNNITTGGAAVAFTKTSGTGTLSGTTDNGNGTYSATLTSPTLPGSATVTATLNGTAVGTADSASQSVVTYTVGPVAAAYSTISPATASLVANGTSTQVITVQARDANSNNITTGGATAVFSLSGVGALSGTTDNGNGTYSATLTAPVFVNTATVTATLNGTAVGTADSASNCVVTYTATGISVQFYPPDGIPHGAQGLTPNQVAGVFPLPDWNLDTNNISGQTTSALYDSLTNATATTVNVAFANGPWGSGDDKSTPDGIMMSGGYPSSGATGYTVSVANVPYSKYNVYVYMLNDNNPNRRYGLTLGTQTYWAGVVQGGGVVFPAAYAQATQTTTNGYTPSTQPLATYVLFTNITGTSFTINGQTPDGVVFMEGMQVVNAANGVTPAVIATQPQTAVVYAGYNATFSATAGGTTPLFYQWRKNGIRLTDVGNIAGSATSTLTVSGVGAGDIANYTLVVTNSVGSVTSSVVTITEVATSARIVWSATNLITTADDVLNQGGYMVEAATFGNTNYLVTLINGTSINFVAGGSAASVNGNGVNYNGYNTPNTYNPGQTTGNADFDNVLNAFSYDGGPKYVTVKNLIPGSQYNVLLIGLLDDPTWAYRTAYFQDPLDPTDVSSTFMMSDNVYVVGTFTALSTNQTIIEQCPLSGNGNMNALVVYASSPASPTITTQPANVRAITNTTANFSVGTTGYPLNYQWYEVSGGVTNLITGATNTSYTTPPVQDSDSGTGFFVVVSNSVTTISVTSSTAILTAGHLVTTTGFLREDEYYNQGTLGAALTANLYPQSTWSGIGTPDKTEYLTKFDDNQDLPGNAGGRIYGWFTPPVSGDYVFFETTDDGGTLWLSTDNTPDNAYEIAQNQGWMIDRDWTCSNTNSGEYTTYYQYGEWRSDLFATVGGQAPLDPNGRGFSPSFNPATGGITLVAGTAYYIELDHFQGGGGQAAAVTYKLYNAADPSSSSASLLVGTNISAALPDTTLPEPKPVITNIVVSGSNVILKGNNGLANAVYNILSSTNVATPLTNWTVTATHVFDINGNFNATNAITPGTPNTFYRLQAQQ